MKRILVVEDEMDSLELLALLLEDEGYEVITAENGRVGLEKATQTRLDLIVTDVMMPFMSGVEMLTEIQKRADLRSIPVIIMSAAAAKEIAIPFECAFMRKPLQIDALVSLVRKVTSP